MTKGNIKANLVNLFLVFTFFSCDLNKDKLTVISGKVINPIGETIEINGPGIMEDGTITSTMLWTTNIDEDGSFSDTLNLKNSAYYYFIHGRERIQLFLEPGNNLSIDLDANEFDESITFSGSGMENNTFLKEKFLFQEKNPVNVIEVSKLESVDYINTIDSLKKSNYEFTNKYSSISNEFRALEFKNIDYSYLEFIQRYPLYHEFYAKKQAVYSDSFMKPLELIDYTNEQDYLLYPTFKQLVISHYQNILDKSEDIEADLNELNLSKSKLIKKDLVGRGVYNLSAGNTRNKDIYLSLVGLTKEFKLTGEDSLISTKLINKFNTLSKLDKGMKSPEFTDFENFKGGNTSLSDLRGKYVYIDVWATWCGPCIREIPSLQKIEKEYHDKNIYFVSLSIDERNRPKYNYEAWRKMIIERELTGIQLFADNAWKTEFTTAYGIDSIPRFLLIDPDGNIVSGNAPRPSDPALVDLFNSLGI